MVSFWLHRCFYTTSRYSTQSDEPVNVFLPCGVAYESDLERVEAVSHEVMDEVLRDHPGAVLDYGAYFGYDAFGESNVEFWLFVQARDRLAGFEVRSELVKQLQARLAAEGITINYPVRTLRFPEGWRAQDGAQPWAGVAAARPAAAPVLRCRPMHRVATVMGRMSERRSWPGPEPTAPDVRFRRGRVMGLFRMERSRCAGDGEQGLPREGLGQDGLEFDDRPMQRWKMRRWRCRVRQHIGHGAFRANGSSDGGRRRTGRPHAVTEFACHYGNALHVGEDSRPTSSDGVLDRGRHGSSRELSRSVRLSSVVWVVRRPGCGWPEGGHGDAAWRSARRPAVGPAG